MSRLITQADADVARDRLRGLGAWNGQGLMVHLALTADKDSSRKWMEPLSELCTAVKKAWENGEQVELNDEQEQVFADLLNYSYEFQKALDEAHAAAGE